MPCDKDIFVCSYPEWQEKRISSTFWQDFSIADMFGLHAIQDTYNRAFGEWKTNYKMLTELVVVLNHKIWQHHQLGNVEASKLYDRLWKEADAWGSEHLKGEELEHFLYVLD